MYSRMEKYHGRRAQRFSIRKYSFGAASVLLGTALVLGANGVQADETLPVNPTTSDFAATNKKDADSALTTPVVEELPELKIDAVKADEKPEVKEEAKTEATPVAEKEITDKAEKEKSDKEQADKKEVDKEKAETVKPKDEVKSVLTQLTSEAEVMATVASNFSDKEAKDVEAKQKLSAAIAAVKLEAVAAKGLLYSNDSTEEQLTAQVNRISSAIEAVYAEMKRAGHAGKVEAVLGATAAKDQTITGKGVIRNGNAIVTVNNAYVTMNADNTAPKAWGIDVVFDTSQAQNGDTTTIEMKNLTGFGDSFKPGTKITAADGTVIGEVSSKETTNSVGSRGGESPFWSQRKKDGKTYEERLTEQPAIPNEVGTTTYTIRWNDKAKNYAVTTFYAENLTAIDYYAPNISKDTEYTAAISVNGQQILEHKYTHKASKSAAQKQDTSATIMGDNILGYKGSERVRKSDAVVINTDSDVRYGKGSKFTITLPNDDFTYFKAIDGSKNTVTNTNKADSISYRPAGRWNNVQANANNVWILNDGRDTNFTLKATVKSPTELEIEVIDGAIQEDSTVSIGLDKLGVEKVITNRTFSDEYSKFIYDEAGRLKDGSVVGDTDKTAATLTVSGGTPLNGGEENVTTKVANGWKVEVGAGGNSQFETGAVTITLVNIETGEEFAYEPTNYDGYAKPNEDGSYETKNILGKKYDVSNQVPDLTKTIKGVEYIRVDVPSKGTTGTVNIGPKRASAIYSSEELQANGVNPNAFVNNVVYYYVKKTKVEEVNRTIKYVYADDVKDLAGQEVFEPTKQTVSYTGTIQVNDKNEAQVDANRKPIYINWVGNGDTNLPEVTVPQKEGYIASVEKVPVQPTTATDEDYEYVVTYSPIQKAKTTFVYQDKDGNVKQVEGNTPISETGKGGDKLTKADEIAARIKEAQNKGYEVVSNTYPTDGVFDKDVDTDQEFTVTLKERVVPVTPDQPKTPGTPVDPNNPDGPKYPAGLEEKDLNKTVTRTITYVYEDGTPVLSEDGTPKTVAQEAKFTREAKVNLVSGEVTYGDWSEAKDLSEVKSPVVKGFVADKASVAVVNVTGDSEDIKEVVTYKPLGSWVPNIPGQPTDPIKYPNDPTDPTTPGTDKPKVPYVEGFTPKDKDGNPLKPVNPNDPKEGYEVPNLPTDPSQDTPINYVKDTQKAKTTFVDEKGNPIPGVDAITEEGDSDTPLTKEAEVKAKIKELENKGYELVSNTYPEGGKFDKDKDTDQEFKVTLKERVVPVTPDQPKTPGTPVDPNNPDGPKYPAGLEEKDLNKTVTRTITYLYEDGTPVLNEDGTPKVVTQEAKFTREAKVNLVTGEVTYGDWTPAQDLAEVKSPVVPGYLADKASVPVVNVTADSKDTTEVVTYKPLGSWVPNIPGQPTNPIKYPNDPTDPTTPGNDKPVLPYVPGMTPKDKDGNPLKPVDPNDPTKGYEVPNVPTNPGEDTPINYVKDTQKAKTTFVDEKGNPIPGVDAITEEGDSDTPLTKEADVKAKIKELENKGYELVSNTYPEGGKFDKDKDTDQEFKVTLKERVVPVTPDQPKTPGAPVDPNNPDGPKYPAGLEEKDLNKTVIRTITYVYEDGTPVLNEDGTPKVVTQEAKFTREAKVNLVTGEVTYGDWTPAQDLAEVKSPVVKGYLADKVTVPTTKVTADSKDTKEVVTYKPLGSWIPNIPGQPTNPIKYPNDPADPTKPGSDKPVLPYVPGHTPVDGNGQPLKPVDPKDPSKGYEVPNVPTNPGEDTPINYVANKANLVVKYVDEKGKDLLPSETTEGKVGDEYATSGKVITGYVLERVDGEAKGKIGENGTTVTYVYKPLGSWIPNIPGQPTNPIKYPNDPTDPTKPGQPTEVVPYVPGYTPKDKDGNPLKPVDPNDPTKGYEVPSVPTNPGEDTPINYVANKANLVVKYVDENGKELLPSETTEGKVGDEYATSGKVITGYVLERVEGEAKGKIGENGTTVTYVYKPLGSWIPNIPGQPTNPIKYPNDPTDPTKPGSDKPVLPYVPGHTPVDGNGQPLKPVDPNDPTKGYEVPNVPTNPSEDTPINYIPNSPKPNPTPYPGPTPAPTPKPEPKPEPAPVPTTPETPERPVAPVQPEQPTTPTQPAVPTPAETSVPTDSATQPATPKYVEGQKELPNTGTEANASLAALGLLGALGGFGLLARKKKED
ncbi:mucus-binding protein [Streptococcus mitis]|uniref:Cell surface protein n=1 Tax=Streptococcus mitis TaxID=28037 RepID=A0AAX2L427_STRMT|nr:MucBP domain-containing protein [Streptococcus mitis]OOS15248.1 mucus-binding protein [Streptococcus mitis]WMS24828.1 MucBP domain-containing protein [Streptococcus mitis]SUN74740.1 cell surface protein precursor [Streptococcus mitis]